ncbi:MAG: hypothetical protein J3K34DRAFT_523368 [Monoraphidium minutum]|nr:MAG: hypothetical protein J3K34DRAFT_523368 [Monoraphidium minutum]
MGDDSGLAPDDEALAGASAADRALQTAFAQSGAWKRSFTANTAGACRNQRGSLCASGLSLAQRAQLLMATSPQAYDARRAKDVGDFSAVGPVEDQGDCTTCVSFTVLAAAQSAMASALKEDAGSALSEQDFFFCLSVEPGQERTCGTSWSIKAGMAAWVRLAREGRYPVLKRCLPYTPANPTCDYRCKDTDPRLEQGSFTWLQLQNPWEVQDHIRKFGSVVTRFDVFDDMRPFFKKSPSGVYPGPGPGAILKESHAVQIVGYNLEQRFYIVKNTWGSAFAEGGVFRVAFGAAGIANPDDTYGLKFALAKPRPPPSRLLTPSAAKPGCWEYKARPSDFVSRVASAFDVPVQSVLLSNLGVITQPDAYLDGVTLTICGARGAAAGAGTPASPPRAAAGGAATYPQQLDALLAVKAAADARGVLAGWTRAAGGGGGYCKWPEVKCDAGGNVVALLAGGRGELGGALPPASALRGLPRLEALDLSSCGLRGPLPADYASLPGLGRLQLGGNALTGTLPEAWGAMQGLTLLDLGGNWNFDPDGPQLGNELVGTLPPAWGRGLKRLVSLALGFNELAGTLPPEWGALPALAQLHAPGNSLRGPLPAAWAALPLAEVNLGGNELSGSLPAAWGGLAGLRRLHLFDNDFSGQLPKAWAGLTGLEELDLHLNGLAGSLPPEWSALRAVQVLAVHNTSVGGPLPQSWGALPAVSELRLWANRLTGTLPSEWGGLSTLTYVSLDANRLRGPVPAAWGAGMRQLLHLSVTKNPQLTGCVPAALSGQLEVDEDDWPEGTPLQDMWRGTAIMGFC